MSELELAQAMHESLIADCPGMYKPWAELHTEPRRRYVVMAKCALATATRERDDLLAECKTLRKNFAAYLLPFYKADPVAVAQACDEHIDKTGNLLGYVRDAAHPATTADEKGA